MKVNMRQGQFMVYSQGKTKEQWDIIATEDYKLRVRKTWVEATNQWHLEFLTQSVLDNKFELFLTHEEIAKIKDIL
jgi:hypothetical protein